MMDGFKIKSLVVEMTDCSLCYRREDGHGQQAQQENHVG